MVNGEDPDGSTDRLPGEDCRGQDAKCVCAEAEEGLEDCCLTKRGSVDPSHLLETLRRCCNECSVGEAAGSVAEDVSETALAGLLEGDLDPSDVLGNRRVVQWHIVQSSQEVVGIFDSAAHDEPSR